MEKLPRALVILLENVIRCADSDEQAVESALRIFEAAEEGHAGKEIDYMPSRILFQDFTGVPVFVDFAAMRDALAKRGGDPTKINPCVPCTLVVDHSVIADKASTSDALVTNEHIEAKRNAERFSFLKWASSSFQNVKIIPPGSGICHQLNMELISKVVGTDALWKGDGTMACFDTLVGTDSHTTTVNGISVMGWGVGGIEAEAAALGQPISMLVPEVVELKLTGKLPEGASGMDLALRVCQLLRQAQVVGSLVEVTGDGVKTLTATQRACIANMTPEYGATATLFPADDKTFDYLKLTCRDPKEIAFAQRYLKVQQMIGDRPQAHYARTLTLDLSTIDSCLAGPSRPHNRVTLAELPARFEKVSKEHNHADFDHEFTATLGNHTYQIKHGAVAIAAITSCTTATDPAMMIAAGLLARHAVEHGLKPKGWVKKILAPGSHATLQILKDARLVEPLEDLGFFVCGFGCMSCIGNSGPLAPGMHEHAQDMELTSALSGNRNFDGRISPDVAQNYLMQPALVVAYSLAGTLDTDLTKDPLGTGADGKPVMLSDIYPTNAEIQSVVKMVVKPEIYAQSNKNVYQGSKAWQDIPAVPSDTYAWDPKSTYIRRPPYFEDAVKETTATVKDARVLALLGDFVTTDHISPAGAIAPDSPAAKYLLEHGVRQEDWNTYGTRRGNHEVMMRGTFANVKLENALAEGKVGSWTRDFETGKITSIYDAAMDYKQHNTEQIVLAGKMYGSGSSRDWAAKGPALLGVKAVIAESFERIHRSNLIGMGIVPLQYEGGQNAQSLGLDGSETYVVDAIDLSKGLPNPSKVEVHATKQGDSQVSFTVTVRVDTPREGRFICAGGILPYVLEELA